MSLITIADRRAIMTASISQTDFRDLLRRDPRAAFKQATGRAAPEDARISVVEEQSDAWEFVVPAGDIEAELPEPVDPRSVIENDVYDILRDEPEIRGRAIRDPQAFLAERMPLIGDIAVNVREEQPGEVVLVLPHGDSREELGDSALDLVAGGVDPITGGGNSGAQGGDPTDPNLRAEGKGA